MLQEITVSKCSTMGFPSAKVSTQSMWGARKFTSESSVKSPTSVFWTASQPANGVSRYDEVLAHPQYEANESIDQFEHPYMGNMLRVKLPAQFGGERIEPGSASPAHGEHTEEVLKSLGRTDEEIAKLVEADLARGVG